LLPMACHTAPASAKTERGGHTPWRTHHTATTLKQLAGRGQRPAPQQQCVASRRHAALWRQQPTSPAPSRRTRQTHRSTPPMRARRPASPAAGRSSAMTESAARPAMAAMPSHPDAAPPGPCPPSAADCALSLAATCDTLPQPIQTVRRVATSHPVSIRASGRSGERVNSAAAGDRERARRGNTGTRRPARCVAAASRRVDHTGESPGDPLEPWRHGRAR
jgi:hypothetical protein